MKKIIIILLIILFSFTMLFGCIENKERQTDQNYPVPESFSFTPLLYEKEIKSLDYEELKLLMLEANFGEGWVSIEKIRESKAFCIPKDYPQYTPDTNNCGEFSFLKIYCHKEIDPQEKDSFNRFLCSTIFEKNQNNTYNNKLKMQVVFYIDELELNSGEIINDFNQKPINSDAIKIQYIKYLE